MIRCFSRAIAPAVLLLLSALSLPASGQSTDSLAALPPAAASPAAAKERNPRVVLLIADDCPRCEAELARLQQPGGAFASLRGAGWKIGEGPENQVQIVKAAAMAELVERLEVREFPTVACIEGEQIVRSFRSGCTTPLDMWTFGFLLKGIDERPPGMVSEAARVETTGHYPLRGNHWSIDDTWNPSKPVVISHLRGPAHGHQIRPGQDIETWSLEELRSLHDNLHEIEMGGVSFGTTYRAQPSSNFGAARKAGGK